MRSAPASPSRSETRLRRRTSPAKANPLIVKAIELAGGSQAALAAASGLSQQHISKMLRGLREVTPKSAIALEAGTDKRLSRQALCPDFWPPEASTATHAGNSQ
jgi:DNA-binding transcriptional regulator YdaS (Cro superfamily)